MVFAAQHGVETVDENALVSRARGGDNKAWNELVRLYGGKVYGIALRFLLNEKDAEDATQDVWILVARKLDTFRGDSRFGTWIYRIAVNRCLEKLRSKKRIPSELIDRGLPRFQEKDDHHIDHVADWSKQPSAQVDHKIMKAEIDRAIMEVPDKYREVLVLRDVEGFSGNETGELLGLTEAAVKTRLHRARAFVRDKLSKKFGKKPWFSFMRMMLL